jgi:hypothetical protein
VLLCLAALHLQARAVDAAQDPFLLRFGAALRRATGYASAAGLQATAAHAAGWSINPAADDVLRDPCDDRVVGTTLTNTHVFGESGAWFTDTAVTARIRLPGVGTVPIAYARTDTVVSRTQEGLDSLLRSNEFFWGYSARMSDALAIGIQTRFVTAEFQEETTAAPVLFPTRFDTDVLWAVDLNLGLRWACNSRWSVGLFGGIGWGRQATDAANIYPIPNPLPPPQVIPADTLLFSFDDSFRSTLARVGIGFTPNEKLGIYADGEYFHIGSRQGGTLDIARALLGIEIKPCEHRILRFGGSIDSTGEFTFSASVGVDPWENVALELAYQHNAFPEMDWEYGRSQLIELSAVVLF